MKNRFVLRVVIFTLPFFLILVVAEVFARSIPNHYKYKAEWMDKNCNSVKCLVLGNSHMFAGVDPSQLDGCFNLANPSQKLEYDYFLLSKYIDECPNLSVVILMVNYLNLFDKPYELKDGADWNRAIYYNLYFDYPKHSILSKYHYEAACSIYMCSKIEHFIKSKLTGASYDIGCDSLGKGTKYHFNPMTLKELDYSHLLLKEYKGRKGFGIEMMSKNLEYIRKSLELCKQHHIRVILVSPPFWHLYNDVLDKEKLFILNTSVNILTKEYNVEYKDYRSDNRFSYTPTYFKDADHLCDYGAEIFTYVLKNDFGIE